MNLSFGPSASLDRLIELCFCLLVGALGIVSLSSGVFRLFADLNDGNGASLDSALRVIGGTLLVLGTAFWLEAIQKKRVLRLEKCRKTHLQVR